MPKELKSPPPRREPGLLSKTFTTLVRFCSWIIMALFLSVLIEWVGIGLFWPEQGARHAQQLLVTESQYLDQRFTQSATSFGRSVYQRTQQINRWIREDSGIVPWLHRLSLPASIQPSPLLIDVHVIYQSCHVYLLAAFYITQLFFVRLALIILSLTVFLLFALTGLVDGLVERSLRRLGGGRESSNVYNLARKSMMPAFIAACVVYISIPFSVHPAVVMLPFAMLLGFSVKMTFDKLKKYF